MPVLTPTRRRAEEFARRLDDGLPPRADTGPDAGMDTSGVDTSAAALIALSSQLDALPLGPASRYRSVLRARLVAVATVRPPRSVPADVPSPARSPRRATPGRRRPRGLGLVAGALAGVVVIVGLWSASSRSLPGDTLYRVKRTAESVQLAFAGSDVERGVRQLQFARTRLTEIDQLLGQGGGQVAGLAPGNLSYGSTDGAREVAATFADMDHETQTGTQLLLGAYRKDRQVANLRVLHEFTAGQQRRLSAVLPVLPVPSRTRAKASMALLDQLGSRVSGLLTTLTCLPACPPAPAPGRSSGPTPTATGISSPQPSASPGPRTTPTATPTGSASASVSGSPGSPSGAPAGSASSSGSGSPAVRDTQPAGILGGLLGVLGNQARGASDRAAQPASTRSSAGSSQLAPAGTIAPWGR